MRKRFAIALLATALVGCSSAPDIAQLNVHRAASDEIFTTTFDRALFSESAGQTDVVLLGGSAPAGGNAQGVQQVVHVKVLWTPSRTIRLDSPSAGNAMIDWTLTGAGDDKVTYAGSCWARVNVDGDEATVDLREANVSVRQVSGNMTDPLKHAKLEGKFVAKRSDAVVRSYVDARGDATRATATLQATPRKNTP